MTSQRELRSALQGAVELGLCDHAQADAIWLDVQGSGDAERAAQEWIREVLSAPSGAIGSPQRRRSTSALHRQSAYRHRAPKAPSPDEPRHRSVRQRSPSPLATNVSTPAPREAPGALLAAGCEAPAMEIVPAVAAGAWHGSCSSPASPVAVRRRGEAGIVRPRRSTRPTQSPRVLPSSHHVAEPRHSPTGEGSFSIHRSSALSAGLAANQRSSKLSLVAASDLVRDKLGLPPRSTTLTASESANLATRWTVDAARVQLGLPQSHESVPLRQAIAELCEILGIETGWSRQRPKPGPVTHVLSPHGEASGKPLSGNCAHCGCGHTGNFGSGRFCSRECAASFDEKQEATRMAAFLAARQETQ